MTRSPYILRPRSVEEAVTAAAQYPEFALCAGGTALMTERNPGSRPAAPGWLLLQDVPELHEYRETGDGRWRLGSLVSLARLGALTAIAPGLAEAACQAGSRQLRNAATLGGYLVGTQVTSDLIPALLSLDATAEIASAGRTRTQPVEDFLVGETRRLGDGRRPGHAIAQEVPHQMQHRRLPQRVPGRPALAHGRRPVIVVHEHGRARLRPEPFGITQMVGVVVGEHDGLDR